MGFIYFPKCKGGDGNGGSGGGTIDAPVRSVNGKKGHVFLTYKDLNAIRNLQGTIGGIMAGKKHELPLTPEPNTVFITTDRYPNSIYIYNRNKWERIGGEEDDKIEAIGVVFDSSKLAGTNANNVQKALEDAFYYIDLNKEQFELDLKKTNNEILQISKQNGKVKLTEYDSLNFLEHKLSKDLDVENNQLVVKGIQGLRATIKELNSLTSIRSNVQEQIDRLSKIGGLAITVPTHKDLIELDSEKVEVNDLVIVQKDETREDLITLYILNKNRQWEYIGEFDVSLELRDFEIDPVKLDKEVEGILSEENIDKIIVRRSELEALRQEFLSKQINSTDDLREGNVNLYFTNKRVDDRIEINKTIKDLVEKSHGHYNLDIVNEIGETPDGLLTYRGVIVGSGIIDDPTDPELPTDPENPVETITDGRIKLHTQDVLGYLGNKLDTGTLGIENNKVVVNNLKGLLASIDELNLLSGARANIQKQIDELEGKVKMDIDDVAGYLKDKVDLDTIVVKNKKLMAQKLNGQIVSIGEINYSKGLTGNIQEQIDELSRVGSFTAIVKTQKDLANINNPLNGDLAMVSNDETQDGMTTFYMYDKGKWVYGGSFHIELRDFTTDPIDLSSEIKGILSDGNIDSNIVRKQELEALKIKDTDSVKEGRNNLYLTQERISGNINVTANTKARHTHSNNSILDNFDEDNAGRVTYAGKEITSKGEIEWESF